MQITHDEIRFVRFFSEEYMDPKLHTVLRKGN